MGTTSKQVVGLDIARQVFQMHTMNMGTDEIVNVQIERTYGSRRLCIALHTRGITIGLQRVRSLMRTNQLRSVWRRKIIHTTNSKHTVATTG